MSALATTLLKLGDEVTGADRSLDTPNVRFLESLGVTVFPDDGSSVDATTDEVIVSTAIEADNPGLVRAKSHSPDRGLQGVLILRKTPVWTCETILHTSSDNAS